LKIAGRVGGGRDQRRYEVNVEDIHYPSNRPPAQKPSPQHRCTSYAPLTSAHPTSTLPLSQSSAEEKWRECGQPPKRRGRAAGDGHRGRGLRDRTLGVVVWRGTLPHLLRLMQRARVREGARSPCVSLHLVGSSSLHCAQARRGCFAHARRGCRLVRALHAGGWVLVGGISSTPANAGSACEGRILSEKRGRQARVIRSSSRRPAPHRPRPSLYLSFAPPSPSHTQAHTNR
jgi:hypothetical protein